MEHEKRHCCMELNPNPISSCFEDETGNLRLEIYTSIGIKTPIVIFCPFCGYTLPKNDENQTKNDMKLEI